MGAVNATDPITSNSTANASAGVKGSISSPVVSPLDETRANNDTSQSAGGTTEVTVQAGSPTSAGAVKTAWHAAFAPLAMAAATAVAFAGAL